jgi:hypothetical protein
MSTLAEIATAIASTLEPIESEIAELQVYAYLNPNPTPPALDLYPGDPFQESLAFGRDSRRLRWVVRARVSTADHEAGQLVLFQLMEPAGASSVAAALFANSSLDDTVDNLSVEGPSGFQVFDDPAAQGSYLGVTWDVEILNRTPIGVS